MDTGLINEIGEIVSALRIHESTFFYLREVVETFSKADIKDLFRLDARLAVSSGAYATQRKSLEDQYGIRAPSEATRNDLSKLLGKTLFTDWHDGGSDDEISRFVFSTLESQLAVPKFCAQVLARKTFCEASLYLLLEDASRLRGEIGSNDYSNELDEYDLSLIDEFLTVTDTHHFDYLRTNWLAYEHFWDKTRVAKRHLLFPTNYTLILSKEQTLPLRDPIETLILESTKNPSLIRRLRPRDFEKFVQKLFESFGFEVQLTACTHDGGVDLVCMSYMGDIPLKVAVEVKRYEKRPITVGMVRSFVGANRVYRASKLVFVTTSRYTTGAKKYANDPFCTDLLELREFSDVLRWAQEFKLKRSENIS